MGEKTWEYLDINKARIFELPRHDFAVCGRTAELLEGLVEGDHKVLQALIKRAIVAVNVCYGGQSDWSLQNARPHLPPMSASSTYPPGAVTL